jgi:UDP-glucose 4-epimerase
LSTVLITGVSGFIGARLATELASTHRVVGLSRKQPKDVPLARYVKGSFELFEDLRQLDNEKIDAVVHLAAVTGGCSEEDGLAVNVQGTRRLMRYLVDRGTRKFVLASSIAAVGCLTGDEPRFTPLHLPMRPDHPNVGRDAYGLSKAMMEEVAKFFARSYPDLGVMNLRFGAVHDEASYQPTAWDLTKFPAWAFVLLGRVALSDIIAGVKASLAALDRGVTGFRGYNLVGPDSGLDEPVADALRTIFGPRASALPDLSRYQRPGHEHAPLWSMDETERDLGFVPRVPAGPKAFAKWKETQP